MILGFLKKDPLRQTAISLYTEIVAAARRPEFFAEGRAPDTVEGRFEVLSLHMYLVLRRLKSEGAPGKALSQKLFDVFFQNMDDSLRELGVGDLTVGKKIRKMAEAFYGRTGAYEDALSDNDEASKTTKLAGAVARNVMGADPENGAPMGAVAIAAFMQRAEQDLAVQSIGAFESGSVRFADFSAPNEP
ncbi:MAG: ubiquinol-cytochrome C chaperone family protein [Pseudomonadota bacterium]